jgi:hypothetical protein
MKREVASDMSNMSDVSGMSGMSDVSDVSDTAGEFKKWGEKPQKKPFFSSGWGI